MAAPSPVISAVTAADLIDHACERGMDRDELCRRLAVDPAELSELDRRVPAELYARLLAQVVRELDEPSLPVVLARRTRLEAYQVMGFAIMTASSAGEALERAIRYTRLLGNAGRYELSLGDEVVVRWQAAPPRDLGWRLLHERAVCQFFASARRCIGRDFVPRRVCFRHPAPARAQEHDDYFGCAIQWRAERDEFSFATELLELRPTAANQELGAYLTARAEEMLLSVDRDDPTTRVREAIAAALAAGEPSAAAVARAVAMSERSLRRHLAAANTSFRALVDDIRRERAGSLLRTGTAVTDAAFLLGFSDPSAFSRAFRRWYGVPPRQYRSA